MAEPTAPTPTTPEPTATPAPKEPSILATPEPVVPAPEKKLFSATPTVEEAKAAALKELADKEAKVAADAAAKKAEEEKAKSNGTVTKEPDKAASTSQTEYTLNLPENSPLTKEDLEGLQKEAKESGLSEVEAKELLHETDQVARTAQTRLVEKQKKDYDVVKASWKEAVKKDPELGGENLAATAIKASRAFKAVASLEMQKFCEDAGFADHPEMVRMMLRVYDLIGEDKFIRGTTGAQNNTPTTTEEKAKKLFGNPIKEAVA